MKNLMMPADMDAFWEAMGPAIPVGIVLLPVVFLILSSLYKFLCNRNLL